MLQQHSNNNIRAVPVSVTSSNNAVENSAPSPSSESSESSLVLSSSASSTSSHSVHANPGSIVSHDQVRYRLKFFAKHNAVSNVNKGLLKIWPQNKWLNHLRHIGKLYLWSIIWVHFKPLYQHWNNNIQYYNYIHLANF